MDTSKKPTGAVNFIGATKQLLNHLGYPLLENGEINASPLIEKMRQNPQKFLAMARKLARIKPYFKEDNQEEAIIKMLNSGLGRKGLRELARTMQIQWKLMVEMIDTIYEFMPERLTKRAKLAIFEKYKQRYINDKMSQRQFNLRTHIMHLDMDMTQAEEYEALTTMEDKNNYLMAMDGVK